MLDNLIRDVSARWGLGDQGRPLTQMLVAYMSNPATGGLNGFLNRFRDAGMDSMVNSWVSNQATPEQPTATQVESVLGSTDGFLHQAAQRLALPFDKVVSAISGLLPVLVSRMTPDGRVDTALPAEFDSWARDGAGFWGAGAAAVGAAGVAGAAAYNQPRTVPPTAGTAHTHSTVQTPMPVERSGVGKWLPWLAAALVVVLGVSYCSSRDDTPADTSNLNAPPATAPSDNAPASTITPPPATDNSTLTPTAPDANTSSTAPLVPGSGDASSNSFGNTTSTTDTTGTLGTTDSNSSAPMTDSNASSSTSSSTTSSSDTAAMNVAAPDGAGVVDDMHNGMPVLRVFFDTGKTDVASEFADKSKSLVEFLKANPDVTAYVSGFNDPTGDPARNAELSKQRAEAVKAALESAGLAADRAVLEKPAETTDTTGSNASSRRVDVMLRR